MHYYQFNIADYRKDTGHLSLLEHGIYRQLLDEYYLNQKPIETQQVIRRLSIKTQEEKTALENVLNDFFNMSECGKFYTKKRCDKEINDYLKKAEVSRANGSKGGRPSKPRKTQQVILANPEETQTKGNSLTNKPINLITKLIEEEQKHPHSTTTFSMNPEWEPSESFDSLCVSAGIRIDENNLPVDELQEFRTYWLTKPEKKRTQSEWEFAFIKNLKSIKLRAVK